ncbi:WD-repeat containing protein SWD2 [Rhodotorula paludigena]|uniref:WD-repeat containing protein SWD2 n=1 Tax=Rhodotorula paludigena TaxID=86838 RepID=UPI0031753151
MEGSPAASTSTGFAASLPRSTPLTPQVVRAYKPAKVFKNHLAGDNHFTSVDFDDEGEFLITTAGDDHLQLFNVRSGKHVSKLPGKKYGCHLARFTHKNTAVVHASTKENNDLRYLHLPDTTFLRYFKGHTKPVVSLQMSPLDDTFLSGSTDDTVRLWDLRAASAQGLLNIAGHPCVAYDPSGAVFAVVLNLRSTVMLYDIRNFDKQPFLCIHIEDPILSQRSFPPRTPVYTSVSFSNDGKWLLVGTSGDVHYVLDSFDGNLLARLELPPDQIAIGLERAPTAPYDRPMEPAAGISSEELSWSPDGRYIVSGSIDGRLHIWDFAPPEAELAALYPDRPRAGPTCTLHPIKSLDGHTGGSSRAVAHNPKCAMLASAGRELAFWLPDPKESGLVPGDGAKAEEA